jgi:hypothetical protein
MSTLRLRISMSLDGFVAGPSQSVKDPLGKGGERLFQGLGDDLRGLQLVQTVATPTVTHLRFARR